MLAKAQIKIINIARVILRDMQVKSRRHSESEFASGSFSEACNNAEKALGNVLVVDRFLMGNENITDDALQGKEGS